ncbi:site-specific integrase [Paenibacillus illinoisensis]|uniref:tyrosine-type recombinase/integrase n=1 Tax=Paenibacillus illinoisensis TaxID=59845 RepID=UPI00301CA157
MNKAVKRKKGRVDDELVNAIDQLMNKYDVTRIRSVLSARPQLIRNLEGNKVAPSVAPKTIQQAFVDFESGEDFPSKESSKKTYRSEIKIFLGYCANTFEKGTETEVNAILNKRFMAEYLSQWTNDNTRNKKASFLRSFLHAECRELIIKDQLDLKKLLPLDTVDHDIPLSFTLKQALEIVNLSRSGNNNLRNHTLITTLLGSGIRVGEIVMLKTGDIDWETQSLWVHPMKKGLKAREKRKINNKALEVLSAFTNFTYGYVMMDLEESEYNDLFIFSKNGGKSHLSVRTIQEIVKNLIYRCKTISKEDKERFSTHTTRHTFAMQLLDAGVNFYTISELLGHDSFASTTRYLKLFDEQLVQAVEKHPFSHTSIFAK